MPFYFQPWLFYIFFLNNILIVDTMAKKEILIMEQVLHFFF